MRKTFFSAIAAAGLAVSLSALATGCKQEVAASQHSTTVAEPVKAEATESHVRQEVPQSKRTRRNKKVLSDGCTAKKILISWPKETIPI